MASLFLGDPDDSGSLLSVTVQLDAEGSTPEKREAIAVYKSRADAVAIEQAFNGVILQESGAQTKVTLETRQVCPDPESDQGLQPIVAKKTSQPRNWPVRGFEGYRKVFGGVYSPKAAKYDLSERDLGLGDGGAGPHPPEVSRRLYVANIPKSKTQTEIFEYFKRCFYGVTGVILYSYPGSDRNRGFCFVEFSSVKAAMMAKEAIVASRPWGCNVVADWADPEYEPDEEVMKDVKVLYLKNIGSTTTEKDIRRAIEVSVPQVDSPRIPGNNRLSGDCNRLMYLITLAFYLISPAEWTSSVSS